MTHRCWWCGFESAGDELIDDTATSWLCADNETCWRRAMITRFSRYPAGAAAVKGWELIVYQHWNPRLARAAAFMLIRYRWLRRSCLAHGHRCSPQAHLRITAERSTPDA